MHVEYGIYVILPTNVFLCFVHFFSVTQKVVNEVVEAVGLESRNNEILEVARIWF